MASRFITPVPFYPYSAPLFYNNRDEQYHKTLAHRLYLATALIKFLDNQYKYWILDTLPGYEDLRPYQWAGCKVEPDYTYLLDLSQVDENLSGFSQTLRKKARQAHELNPKIEKSSDSGPLIELYRKSYERHGITPLINLSQIQSIMDRVLRIQQFELYYISFDAKPVSARLLLNDSRRVYDVLAGSEDDSGLGTVYLLSKIFQKYNTSGKSFDFMGAGHPEIDQFKRGFGGKLVHGFRISGRSRFPLSMLIKMRDKEHRRRRKI